jgi:hypothetical protein
VKRRLGKRRTADLTATAEWVALTGDANHPLSGSFAAFLLGSSGHRDELRQLWVQHGAAVLAEWVRRYPGTRPVCWWRWDAPRWAGKEACGRDLPEPRQRLGGTGDPCSDDWEEGIPRFWVSWPGRKERPVNPADPPLYEAEATYLRRHGLLLRGEAARLKAADYEPVAVVLEGSDG